MEDTPQCLCWSRLISANLFLYKREGQEAGGVFGQYKVKNNTGKEMQKITFLFVCFSMSNNFVTCVEKSQYKLDNPVV